MQLELHNDIIKFDKKVENRNDRSGSWRRCMVLSESLQEVMVRLPKNLLNEVDGLVKKENRDLSDIICQATRTYLETKKEEYIQNFYKSMQKGYQEMARINLSIASEAFQAEEEAEITLERSVIGV